MHEKILALAGIIHFRPFGFDSKQIILFLRLDLKIFNENNSI
jgi:hypothetical protein